MIWDECVEQARIFNMVVGTLWVGIALFFMLCGTCFVSRLFHARKETSFSVTCLASSTCVLMFIAALTAMLRHVAWFFYCDDIMEDQGTTREMLKRFTYWLDLLCGFWYLLVLLLASSLYTLRLKISFAQTEHELSQWAIGVFIMIMILALVMGVAGLVKIIIDGDFKEAAALLILESVLFYVILCFLVAGLFIQAIHKIARYSIDQLDTQHMNAASIQRVQGYSQLISRWCVLLFIQIASSLVFMLLWTILIFSYRMTHWTYIVFWSYGPVECFFNALSLMLLFKFNYEKYTLLCGKLDRFVSRHLLKRFQPYTSRDIQMLEITIHENEREAAAANKSVPL